MPAFREGPVIVDRRFDGDALKEFRDADPGNRINIVDIGYEIPRRNRIVEYIGSSAGALLGIARLLPIEDGKVTAMSVTPGLDEEFQEAWDNFQKVRETLQGEGIGLAIQGRFKERPDGIEGTSFYDLANSPDERRVYVRTQDDLPFACASLAVGGSR